MRLHEFIRECGNQEKAADALQTNRQQIRRWLKRDAIIVNGVLYAPICRLDSKQPFKVES